MMRTGLTNEVQVSTIPLYPPRFKARLRYFTTATLSSTSGAVASHVFSANGLYDPDITGTGHQPAGYDQVMLSYEHYTVLRSKITATFHNNTSTVAPTAAVSLNASSTPITIWDQIMEDGAVNAYRMNPSPQAGSICTLEYVCDVKRFAGVDDLMDNSDYRGSLTTMPAEQSYFILQIWNTELGTSSSAVDVLIEYEAVFTEPRKLTESLASIMRSHLVAEEKKAPDAATGSRGNRVRELLRELAV